MYKILIMIVVLALGHTAFSKTDLGPIQKNHCDFFESEGLKTILVPLDHTGEFSNRQLAYGYQAIENSIGEKNPKTLVYLTGGPGNGMIGNDNLVFFDNLLKIGFNLILIDPRGVGCNGLDYGEVPDEVITTEQTALDIVEVIKAEKIIDYIIMGQSYGTMLGTVLTSTLNKMIEVAQPELLVLSGTFSRRLETGTEFSENMVKVFHEKMPKHFPAVKNIFFGGKETSLPFGISLDYWDNILVGYASLGVESFSRINPEFVRLLDGYPNSLNDSDLETYFKTDFDDFKEFFTSAQPIDESDVLSYVQYNYVYYSIMCKEMSPVDVNLSELQIVNGMITVISKQGSDICSVFDFSEKPYDSADYELTTKTLYFQGTSDGQTPLYYFEYHYDNNSAEKEAVKVSGGGHGLFYTDLEVCTSQVWSEIKMGSTNFENILDQGGHCLRPD